MRICFKYSKHKQKWISLDTEKDTVRDIHHKIKEQDPDILDLDSIILVYKGIKLEPIDNKTHIHVLKFQENDVVSVFINNKKNSATLSTTSDNSIRGILDNLQQSVSESIPNNSTQPISMILLPD